MVRIGRDLCSQRNLVNQDLSKGWKSKNPSDSFYTTTSEPFPPSLDPILPYLGKVPSIRDVPFETRFHPLNMTLRKENVYELMAFDYCPPADSSGQELCVELIRRVGLLLHITMARESFEPLAELLNSYRGWRIHQGKRSQTLVYLLMWKNAQDEARVKGHGEHSHYEDVVSSQENVSETNFLAVMKEIEAHGWFVPQDNCHLRLLASTTSLSSVDRGWQNAPE